MCKVRAGVYKDRHGLQVRTSGKAERRHCERNEAIQAQATTRIASSFLHTMTKNRTTDYNYINRPFFFVFFPFSRRSWDGMTDRRVKYQNISENGCPVQGIFLAVSGRLAAHSATSPP
ncbi:MAG: hypothetical protein LBJ47_12055 [Tannerella sp.]|nr:hypothetical protein [Tannerella sp.]